MKCLLIIDTGGTKCDALFVREDGVILGWGHYNSIDPATGLSSGGSGRDPDSVADIIREATGGRHAAELQAYFMENDPQHPIQTIPPHQLGLHWFWKVQEFVWPIADKVSFHCLLEHLPALALHNTEVGIVVIAGTGATIYGRTPDGRGSLQDGLGPMLGDYGSAYYIGDLALRAAAKNDWHPRHRTSLAPIVYRLFKIQPLNNLGRDLALFAHTRRDRSEIAALARFVDSEAMAGDAVARRILEQAAEAQATTVFDIAHELGMADRDTLVIGMGSVASRSKIYWDHFTRKVKAFAPRFRTSVLRPPPVLGLALCALKNAGWVPLATAQSNLFASAPPFMSRVGYDPVTLDEHRAIMAQLEKEAGVPPQSTEERSLTAS